MKKIKETTQAFDELSERYDLWYSSDKGNFAKQSELFAVKKLLPEGVGLEVGVGSGIFSSELNIKYGVDPSRSLLRKAQSRGIDVVIGIGEELPFREESFDFLLFVVTICFLSDPLKSLREANRVLKSDGKLLVCVIPKKSPWGRYYINKKKSGHDFYKHAKFYKLTEIKKILKDTGFKTEAMVSSLFQDPNFINKVEKPVEGLQKSAGFCCIKAEKDG